MSRVSLDKVLNTGRFDHDKAQEHPLWFKELYGFAEHKPETEEYGVRRLRVPGTPSLSSRENSTPFINSSWPGGPFVPRGASGWPTVLNGSAS